MPPYKTTLSPVDWSVDTRVFVVPRGAAPRGTAKIRVPTDQAAGLRVVL